MMRCFLIVVLFITAILFLNGAAGFALDIPLNAASSHSSAMLEPHQDPRLEQVIQLEGVQLRLFQITDEISRQTGIEVLAGDDPQDWMVRDLPVTLYVYDLKASVVMQSLAELLHLHLSPEQGKDAVAWRLWRDSETREAMNDFEAYRKAAGLEKISRDLDKLLEAANLPEDAWTNKPPRAYSMMPSEQSVRDLLTAISGLSQVQKDLLRNGGTLSLSAANLPPGVMERLHRDLLKQRSDFKTKYSLDVPKGPNGSVQTRPQDELTNARITLEPEIEKGRLVIGLPSSNSRSDASTYLYHINSYTAGKGPKPEPWVVPNADWDLPFPEAIVVPADKEQARKDFLREKLILPQNPGDGDVPRSTRARTGEKIIELAKLNYINVIIEDHVSQTYSANAVIVCPDSSRGLVASLLWVDRNLAIGMVCPDQRLIMNSDRAWMEHQNRLVPYAVLEMLEHKASTSGLDLDDLAALALLDDVRLFVWILQDRKYGPLRYKCYFNAPLFQIYAGLSTDERTEARSVNGLPLKKVGLKRLEEMTAIIEATASSNSVKRRYGLTGFNLSQRYPPDMQTVADPHRLMELSLFVVSNQDPNMNKRESGGTTTGGGRYPDNTTYSMELRGPDGKREYSDFFCYGLPFYTEARKYELQSEMSQKANTNTDSNSRQ